MKLKQVKKKEKKRDYYSTAETKEDTNWGKEYCQYNFNNRFCTHIWFDGCKFKEPQKFNCDNNQKNRQISIGFSMQCNSFITRVRE